MKMYFYLLFSISLVVFCFTSCDGSSESSNNEEVIAEYYCPMKCQMDTTYSHAGSCPVCGMDLIEK